MCDLHPKVSGNQILYLDFGQLTELRMFGIQITKSSKFQILDLLGTKKNYCHNSSNELCFCFLAKQ